MKRAKSSIIKTCRKTSRIQFFQFYYDPFITQHYTCVVHIIDNLDLLKKTKVPELQVQPCPIDVIYSRDARIEYTPSPSVENVYVTLQEQIEKVFAKSYLQNDIFDNPPPLRIWSWKKSTRYIVPESNKKQSKLLPNPLEQSQKNYEKSLHFSGMHKVHKNTFMCVDHEEIKSIAEALLNLGLWDITQDTNITDLYT